VKLTGGVPTEIEPCQSSPWSSSVNGTAAVALFDRVSALIASGWAPPVFCSKAAKPLFSLLSATVLTISRSLFSRKAATWLLWIPPSEGSAHLWRHYHLWYYFSLSMESSQLEISRVWHRQLEEAEQEESRERCAWWREFTSKVERLLQRQVSTHEVGVFYALLWGSNSPM